MVGSQNLRNANQWLKKLAWRSPRALYSVTRRHGGGSQERSYFAPTRLLDRTDRRRPFEDTKRTVADGGQVLVVYPRKTGEGTGQQVQSVQAVVAAWEQVLPGRVRSLTGSDDAGDKATVIADLHAGNAAC